MKTSPQNHAQLGGMYAALMTGIADDGQFDEHRQRNINAYVLRQGLKGIYVGGSSGESGLLSVDELLLQQAIVAQDAKKTDAVLIAHVGAPSTMHSVQLARHAKKLGFHALSALPPHAYPFSDDAVYAYYAELAAATDLPLIVYEIPLRTGRAFSIELLSKIFAIPNVAGIKFTSTDLFKLSMLQKKHPDKIYYSGFDEIYASAAVLEPVGGIGTTYNILGKLYAEMYRCAQANDFSRTRQLQKISQEFVEELLPLGVLPGMKAAFQAIGVDCGPTRLPLILAQNNGVKHMQEVMNRPHMREWLV